MNHASRQLPATPPRAASRARAAIRPRRRGGFTLIEVLIASALLGFSLLVMFGFHTQAVRSNMHARKMTDCTYLAQLQMERLLSLRWTQTDGRPSDLEDDITDTTVDGNNSDEWPWLEHPEGGTQPDPVNAANSETNTELGQPIYYLTWDVEDMDEDDTWVKLKVRCQYKDEAFDRWHGTTISTYRFRD